MAKANEEPSDPDRRVGGHPTISNSLPEDSDTPTAGKTTSTPPGSSSYGGSLTADETGRDVPVVDEEDEDSEHERRASIVRDLARQYTHQSQLSSIDGNPFTAERERHTHTQRRAMDSFSSSPSSGSNSQFQSEQLKNQLKAQLAQAYIEQFMETISTKCFDKCITKPGSSMSGSESSCISRCVDRYIEATGIITSTLFSSPH